MQTARQRGVLRPSLLFFGLLIGGRLACYGQAVVTSVTDSAGYGPRVAPGSLASIFGTGLASSTAGATGFPLPTSLGGTSVEISGVLAPLLYVNSTQINFQVPSSLSAGQVSLVVHGPGGDSSAFTFTVIAEAPAIFQYGTNHAVAQNGDAAHSLNSDSSRAAAGSVITVYLTGQGPLDNPVADGVAAPSTPLSKATATATATIGVQNAPIQFLGLTPGFAGLAQANIQVPTLPTGDYPLVLTVGGIVSVSVVVSVSGSGTPFTSPLSLVGTAIYSATGVRSIALYSNLVYVCGANRIRVVDVTDPTKPTVLGQFGSSTLNPSNAAVGYGTICAINAAPTGVSPYLVDVIGPLSNSVSLAVFDLTNPKAPQLLGVTPTNDTYIVDLNFFGNYGFASVSYFSYDLTTKDITAQTGKFLSFDFTNPATPLALPELDNAGLEPASAVVNQTFAYIASSTATGGSTNGYGALDVINIGVPSGMSSVNQITVTQAAILLSFDIAANTGVLLAAGNTTGNRDPGDPDFDFTGNLTLTTMGLKNVAGPAVQVSFDTGLQVNGTFHTNAFTNGVFAIVNGPPATDDGGPASLMIVDARNPQNPKLYPFQTQFGFGPMVTTSAWYLLAANSLGLYVYQLQSTWH
jgi:uncharacterized protein (TIGR03437 family)